MRADASRDLFRTVLNKDRQNERLKTPFGASLARALERRGLSVEKIYPTGDALARRLLAEYGAMFIASDAVSVPPQIVFKSEEEVSAFQRESGLRAAEIEGVEIELQPAALEALLDARREAERLGLKITPRGGSEAARRSFADTQRLWDSRCLPAIEHWRERGELSTEECETLCCMGLREQVESVLALEGRGLFFSKDFTKSILQSVAAPGASQHLAALAFDASEFQDARVSLALARQGWFQTVLSDLPHFTFLGHDEARLPALGLKRVEMHGQVFWIPDMEGEEG